MKKSFEEIAVSTSHQWKLDIDRVLEKHGASPAKLLEILLEVQEKMPHQYLPKQAAYYIAEKMDIKMARLYDVISFFSALHQKPRGKYPIQICSSIVCEANNKQALYQNLKDILGIDIGETTYDGRFTLEQVTCFGACDVAPAVRVNGRVYGHLDTREKVLEMLQELEQEDYDGKNTSFYD